LHVLKRQIKKQVLVGSIFYLRRFNDLLSLRGGYALPKCQDHLNRAGNLARIDELVPLLRHSLCLSQSWKRDAHATKSPVKRVVAPEVKTVTTVSRLYAKLFALTMGQCGMT
jgi:hypothetical protein